MDKKKEKFMFGHKVLGLMLSCETEKEYENNAKQAAEYIHVETLSQLKVISLSYNDLKEKIRT